MKNTLQINGTAAEASLRSLILFEVLAFTAYIACYIWQLQAYARFSWLVFPVWLIASFVLHQDTLATLGWRADNLWIATKRFLPFFIPSVMGLFVVGFVLGGSHRSLAHLFFPNRFFGYMAFCFLQQLALNSYLTNRLLAALHRPFLAHLLAGTIFALLHWPNPVLVPLTLVVGAVMSWLFASERNIVPLAVGQGILGTLVWWAFPLAWHHAMRVGPGFYYYHPR